MPSHFTKKLDSGDPTVASLDLTIKNDIAIQRMAHNIVLMVTLYLSERKATQFVVMQSMNQLQWSSSL